MLHQHRRFSLLTAGCLLAFTAHSGMAAEVIPFAPGNKWVLKSVAMATPFTLSVTSDETLGDLRRVALQVESPWLKYSYLLNPAADGVKAEGMTLYGTSYRFASPISVFPYNAAVGETWRNDLGVFQMVSRTAAVTTPLGSYSNVLHYRQTSADGNVQSWFIAPNVGFVQYGEGYGAFGIQQAVLNTPLPLAAPAITLNGPCPIVGIDANPAANGSFSSAGKSARLDTAIQNGSRLVRISADWQELEAAPNVYSLSRIQGELNTALQKNIAVALKIRTVDTNSLKLPADLAGRPLNDPVVILRFQKLLQSMTSILNSPVVKVVSLANEVDVYFNSRPSEISAFRQFYEAGQAQVKTINPNASTGLIFAYDSHRMTDGVFRQLGGLGDHVGFTYYAIDAGPRQRSPASVAVDIRDMVAAAASRPVFIAEIGYSSSAATSSSETQQQQFYSEVFNALAKTSGKVWGASFFQMSEMPSAQVAALGASYGYSVDAPFLQFLGTLGLMRQDGSAKPAWTVFSTRAKQFLTTNYCTNQ